MTEVRLEGVAKSFYTGGFLFDSTRSSTVIAVDDLSMKVGRKEFFVVVGPNGCGKTTLLRLIAGVIEPDYGDIYFDDDLVNDLSPSKRGVRMIFQSYALYPHMKIYDEEKYSNLSFGLKIQKYLSSKIKNQISDSVKRAGIEKRLFSRKPKELSHGEQQKVAVGRAIAISPRVFLMDEPLSNLDPPSRVKVMSELKKLHKELKTTTIYVTHNLVEAMALADRIAIMNKGRMEQVGTPDEIKNHPKNEFVSDFIKYYTYLTPS